MFLVSGFIVIFNIKESFMENYPILFIIIFLPIILNIVGSWRLSELVFEKIKNKPARLFLRFIFAVVIFLIFWFLTDVLNIVLNPGSCFPKVPTFE